MTEESGDRSSSDQPRPLEEHLTARSTWLRLVFMIVLGICHELARLVGAVVVILQFLHVLFTGAPNDRLKDVGLSLAQYVRQVIEYLTFNTEVRPFPFDAEWPAPRPPQSRS
ncbi:MAG TPA: DUF4389 domain-containing protein [Gammaproteobacteria bacterium]|nr:DUF4389 domain-containing protein [Gammaproteobacteria bacterium]